ncbi:hypothetical protein ABCR94_33390 [Streptomyces sp. 21So2-11]
MPAPDTGDDAIAFLQNVLARAVYLEDVLPAPCPRASPTVSSVNAYA